MQAEERQVRLESYLLQAEFASLEELAQHVGASISTVRRDLDALEKGGNIRRTHGGARTITPPRSDEYVFQVRDTHQVAEKEAIAIACAIGLVIRNGLGRGLSAVLVLLLVELLQFLSTRSWQSLWLQV